MAEVATGILRGGWFPDMWDVPVAMGVGVVLTGYIGDTVAGFVSQWVPADWLNPVSELIIGVALFALGGVTALGGFSRWLRLFSFGAFAVGIADAISVALGLVPTVGVRRAAVTRVRPAVRYAPTVPTAGAATLRPRTAAKPDGARYAITK